MADSKLLTSIGEELECPVCSEYLSDARFLSCMHTFCKSCLEKCDKIYGRGGKISMTCPLCRQVTSLGRNGLDTLQVDYTSNKLASTLKKNIEERKRSAGRAPENSPVCQSCQDGTVVAYCLSCSHFICETCQSLHAKLVAMRTHEVVPLKDLRKGNVTMVRSKKKFCSTHKQDIVCFCYTCTKYLCDMCCMFDHDTHDCSEPNHQSPQGSTRKSTRRDRITQAVDNLVIKANTIDKQKKEVKRLRASVRRRFWLLKDELKCNMDLHIKNITRIMKENHDDILNEIEEDESLILTKIASVDEGLEHTVSRIQEAKSIGDNTIKDGEHDERVFVQDYLSSVVSGLEEDDSPAKILQQVQKYSQGVCFKPSINQDNIKSLASLGEVFHPEMWDEMTSCELPPGGPMATSLQFSSALRSFLLTSADAVFEIDVQHVGGTVKIVSTLQQPVTDMAIAGDGSAKYVLYEDNRIQVFKETNWENGSYVSHCDSTSTLSCIAVTNSEFLFVGNQSSKNIMGYSSELSHNIEKTIDNISPIQMAFTGSGDLAVVSRSIAHVDAGDSVPDPWNEAGVAVRIFGVAEQWENVIPQRNWQAAAVATSRIRDKELKGMFYALGIYVEDDGRQLSSLGIYNKYGQNISSIFHDKELPADYQHDTKPLLALDDGETMLVVIYGRKIHFFQKRDFRSM